MKGKFKDWFDGWGGVTLCFYSSNYSVQISLTYASDSTPSMIFSN